MPPLSPPLTWQRQDTTLRCPVELHPGHRLLFEDYLRHRHRLLRARPAGLLHASDVRYEGGHLHLVFPDKAELARATSAPERPPRSFQRWRDEELLPALLALLDCHEAQVAGFAPFHPVSGRWVPPVSWFLPRPPGPLSQEERRRDLHHARAWVLAQCRQAPRPRDWDTRFVDSLLAGLDAAEANAVERLLRAEQQEALRHARREPPPPSFFHLLTEAEHLERLAQVYRYRLLQREEADRLGLDTRGQLILQVEPRWKDPHFPTLTRPSPQELWDSLLDESRTTPLLALSQRLPNPLLHRQQTDLIARWLGVHEDQPLVYVRRDGLRLPPTGYVHPHQPGDLALMGRKRAFTAFAGKHPLVADHVTALATPLPFTDNPQPRTSLEEAIVSRRGIFVVQGPPGTGKTYLATQVVRKFLAATPAGRVLICAKEHFALDHILRKITERLDQDGTPYRAFRSVSLARRRRGRGELDTTFLGPTVAGELAERTWAPESADWTRFQASTLDQHDQRLLSLAEKASTLYFCTTMDAALLDFAGQTSFDLVIVEEAGKCYPSELLHTLCMGRTVLMIGDQRQLPPYQERRTREAVETWHATLEQARSRPEYRDELRARFGDTFLELEALARAHGPLSAQETAWLRPFEYLFERLDARHRLEEQFRMEAPLSRLVGRVFYGRPFLHRKPASNPLEGVIPPELDVPLLWLDTPHMTQRPEATEDPQKRGVRDNLHERDVLLRYLRCLRPARQVDLVILTPYNDQKRLLLDSEELRAVCRELTTTPFEQVVRTTDEYQGREAELTVLSLVRNNSLGARAWGFMTEPERLNVMFSRTRFRQVVVGCSAHIVRHAAEAPYLHAVWKAYQEEAADTRCARILSPEELPRHG